MSNAKNSKSKNGKSKGSEKNRRSSARLAAVQALYQMDVAQISLSEVMEEFVSFRLGKEVEGEQFNKADTSFFKNLLTGIVSEQRTLDPLIDQHLASSWRLNRIDSTLRAILRSGAYELIHCPNVPPLVVISEYVDVAHSFFETEEPKVVNAVLQNIWKSPKIEQASEDVSKEESESVPEAISLDEGEGGV